MYLENTYQKVTKMMENINFVVDDQIKYIKKNNSKLLKENKDFQNKINNFRKELKPLEKKRLFIFPQSKDTQIEKKLIKKDIIKFQKPLNYNINLIDTFNQQKQELDKQNKFKVILKGKNKLIGYGNIPIYLHKTFQNLIIETERFKNQSAEKRITKNISTLYKEIIKFFIEWQRCFKERKTDVAKAKERLKICRGDDLDFTIKGTKGENIEIYNLPVHENLFPSLQIAPKQYRKIRKLACHNSQQIEDKYLPMIYHKNRVQFRFMDIPDNLYKKNVRYFFQEDFWEDEYTGVRAQKQKNHSKTCQICGRHGGIFNKYESEEDAEKYHQAIQCHEAWSWSIEENIGIQKLETIIVVCKDCHNAFHEETVIGQIEKTHDIKEINEAKIELTSIQQMINNSSDREHLYLQKENVDQRNDMKKIRISDWVFDLSQVNKEVNVKNLPVFNAETAGINPEQIAGLSFVHNGAGQHRSVEDAIDLAKSNLYNRKTGVKV